MLLSYQQISSNRYLDRFLYRIFLIGWFVRTFVNKLPRRKQRGIKNLIKTYYAASGGEFNPE